MDPDSGRGITLVTGACGHVGRELCRVLSDAGRKFTASDLDPDATGAVLRCDLTSKSDVSQLFQTYPIGVVIHLAGILPSAFRTDPLTGANVNLVASCELMRQSAVARVKRFIFASSMSVYGSSARSRPVTEDDPPSPDDPYGASKLAIELVGQALARKGTIEFVALRIARVVGAGIKKTASPWRSEIFEANPQGHSVRMPFAPDTVLSLVHVEDVARMLLTLDESAETSSHVYNTPVEVWKAGDLKDAIEEIRGVRVELAPGADHGGPVCDGSRFAGEFGFQVTRLREYWAT